MVRDEEKTDRQIKDKSKQDMDGRGKKTSKQIKLRSA